MSSTSSSENDKLEQMFQINNQLYQLMEQGLDCCYNSYLDRSILIDKLTSESAKLWADIKTSNVFIN